MVGLKQVMRLPVLAAIIVGDDPASQVYVGHKQKACAQTGIDSELFKLPSATSQEELLDLVEKLNQDPRISGILVQLPVPDHIDTTAVLAAIDVKKDVDCFHPEKRWINDPR